jgi:ABC-type phosphate/phosphonate transport system substrate-binding protein
LGEPRGVCFSLLRVSTDAIFDALALHLAQATGLLVRVVPSRSWAEGPHRIEASEADLGAMGATLFAASQDDAARAAETSLLVAPVGSSPRHRGEPQSYTDLVVHRDAALKSLTDLEGGTLATAGLDVLGAHWLRSRLGSRDDFFGSRVTTDDDHSALELVAGWGVDAAMVDSIGLDRLLRRRPDLTRQLRVLESFGPLPTHPFAVSRRADEAASSALLRALDRMHETPTGAALLEPWGLARLVLRDAKDYARMHAITRVGESKLFESAA